MPAMRLAAARNRNRRNGWLGSTAVWGCLVGRFFEKGGFGFRCAFFGVPIYGMAFFADRGVGGFSIQVPLVCVSGLSGETMKPTG